MSKRNKERRPDAPPQLCVFCGRAKATTRDHVPPKGMFVRPLPNDLVTVPACAVCNTGTSRTDERFRTMLSLRVGTDLPGLAALWDGPILRGIRRNKRFHRELLKNMREADIHTPAGLYLGKQHVIMWDARSHDPTIIKITRGLYFHHFKEVLPASARVKPYYFRRFNKAMAELMAPLAKSSIGRSQFQYAYGRAGDSPYASMWFYYFHGVHFAGAMTMPAELVGQQDAISMLEVRDTP